VSGSGVLFSEHNDGAVMKSQDKLSEDFHVNGIHKNIFHLQMKVTSSFYIREFPDST